MQLRFKTWQALTVWTGYYAAIAISLCYLLAYSTIWMGSPASGALLYFFSIFFIAAILDESLDKAHGALTAYQNFDAKSNLKGWIYCKFKYKEWDAWIGMLNPAVLICFLLSERAKNPYEKSIDTSAADVNMQGQSTVTTNGVPSEPLSESPPQ